MAWKLYASLYLTTGQSLAPWLYLAVKEAGKSESLQASSACRMGESGCQRTADSLTHSLLGIKGYRVYAAFVLKG